jgi:hypothetical protein
MRYGVSGKQAIAVSIHAANESGQADNGFLQEIPKKPEDAKKSSLESWIKASEIAISGMEKDIAKRGFVI